MAVARARGHGDRYNSLRTDGDLCHQGWDAEIAPKNFRLSKNTDMTIHWKGLEEHILMVPLVFLFTDFRGKKKINFLKFSQKNLRPLKTS
jgi:hypothetical protein